jgi:transcriptional accessory protein Tex/SPT6
MNGDAISDSVHYERGYNKGIDKGFINGLKRAFELVEQLGDFYDIQVIVDAPPEELRQHAHDRKQQANACRYAQHVIRKNDFNNEDLPW